ncbi:MAG: hypothetical protein JXA09_06850, partial [Anaerolineae bacterium]|nr:hypothetical protein [Anaerolineae bacterium]
PDLPPAGGDAAARAAGGSQAADPWRRALDHTVESVPPELRNSEQWKQRIAPLLDQARQWDDPGRIQALDDRIRAIVDLRRQIDSNPAYRALPKHHQDALIWRRRGDDLLGAAREQDRQRLLSGPAQKPARPPAPGAPSPSAAPTQQKEVEFIDDLRTYPVRRVESPFRAQQRQQGDDPIARDLWRYRRVDPHKPGFESGWEKGKRWWRELKVLYEELRFGIPRPPAED